MQNGPMLDWNDLRYFLAVAREGSTLAASRTLRVSQTTVARRIEMLEQVLGIALFERRRTGYVPTEAAAGVMAAAEAAEAAMLAFQAEAQSRRRAVSGAVRLTTNELLANQVLVGAVEAFRAAFPAVRLEITTTDRRLDLAHGEADVALRASGRPTQPDLVGRRLAVDNWSFWCSRAYAERRGMPRDVAGLADHAVIGVELGAFTDPLALWFEKAAPDAAIVLRRNSIDGVFAAIRSGLGVSLMSDLVAASDPDFVRCFTPQGGPQPPDIWLLTHERLRDVPRVRAVMDFIGAYCLKRFSGG